MSEEAGAVATETKTTENDAPLIPGREEVLKQYATDVLGAQRPPEPQAGDEKLEVEKPQAPEAGKPNALSQTETKLTEPNWTDAQKAWFAQMDAAQTPEAIAAAQAQQPAFSAEEIKFLEQQNAAAEAKPEATEDHLQEDAELKGKLDAATQERINRRIGKEVAKTKEAKEQAEQMTAKVQELEDKLAATPVSRPDGRTLAHLTTPAQIQAAEKSAQDAMEQAEDLLAQIEDDPDAVAATLQAAKVGLPEFSPAAMKKFLTGVKRNADHTLRRELPQRVQFLNQVNASAKEALTILPELNDAKSERRKAFDQMVTNAGEIGRQFGQWPQAIALMVLGQETLAKQQAAAKAAATPAKAKRPIPVTIPLARGAMPSVRPEPAKGVTDDTVSAALSGDKKARLKYLQSLVPKM